MPLDLDPNFQDADGFFEALLHAHEGLDRDASEALNARLILILANQIGDSKLLTEALNVAAGEDAKQ